MRIMAQISLSRICVALHPLWRGPQSSLGHCHPTSKEELVAELFEGTVRWKCKDCRSTHVPEPSLVHQLQQPKLCIQDKARGNARACMYVRAANSPPRLERVTWFAFSTNDERRPFFVPLLGRAKMRVSPLYCTCSARHSQGCIRQKY